MKEKDKYIDHLFEAAKKEPPKISFEEMTQRFESAVQASSASPIEQSWWSSLLNLNTILMLSIGIFTIAFFFSTLSSSTEQSSVLGDQALQKKEVMATTLPENKTAKTSDTSIYKVEKTIIPSTILGKNKGTKKTIIPKNNLSTPPSISDISTNLTNSSIVKTEPLAISNAPLTTVENAKKVPTKVTKDASYTAKDSNATIKPVPDEVRPSTNVEMELPIPTKITASAKEIADSKSNVLRLNYTDSQETTQVFLSHLQQYGLEVDSRVIRTPKKIRKIVLDITHKNGLDWNLKIRNFKALEFKVDLDTNDRVNSIAYRLNQQEDFSEPLTLYHKARSNHKFSANSNTRGNHSFTRKLHLKNNQ